MTDCIGKSCDKAPLETDEGKEALATMFGNMLGFGYSCYVNNYATPDGSSSTGFALLSKTPSIYFGGMLVLGANLLL